MSEETCQKTTPAYREYLASPSLAEYVECFWTYEIEEPAVVRVLPDGCADILLTRTPDRDQVLRFVGTMARAHLFELSRTTMLGVRFRPGCSSLFVAVPGTETTDRTVSLEDLWGARASELNRQLIDCSISKCAAHIEEMLAKRLSNDSNGSFSTKAVRQALGYAESRCGNVSIERLANLAGLSCRQFQRICIELTGITPKQLCRSLRLRLAATQILEHSRGDWAKVANDCGYYDQSHLINDFRDLIGITPTEYRASFGQDRVIPAGHRDSILHV